jgi:hypothetical protein
VDYEDLYTKFNKDIESLRVDLHKVEYHLATKLDSYQQRVTKLEADQGWTRWALLLVITSAIGVGLHYIKKG